MDEVTENQFVHYNSVENSIDEPYNEELVKFNSTRSEEDRKNWKLLVKGTTPYSYNQNRRYQKKQLTIIRNGNYSISHDTVVQEIFIDADINRLKLSTCIIQRIETSVFTGACINHLILENIDSFDLLLLDVINFRHLTLKHIKYVGDLKIPKLNKNFKGNLNISYCSWFTTLHAGKYNNIEIRYCEEFEKVCSPIRCNHFKLEGLPKLKELPNGNNPWIGKITKPPNYDVDIDDFKKFIEKNFEGIFCASTLSWSGCPNLKKLPNGLIALKIDITGPLDEDQDALIVFKHFVYHLQTTFNDNAPFVFEFRKRLFQRLAPGYAGVAGIPAHIAKLENELRNIAKKLADNNVTKDEKDKLINLSKRMKDELDRLKLFFPQDIQRLVLKALSG